MSNYITLLEPEYMQARPDYYLHDGRGWLYTPPSGTKTYSEQAAKKQAAKLAKNRGEAYEILKVQELWKGKTSYIPIRSGTRNDWVEYLKQFGAFKLLD